MAQALELAAMGFHVFPLIPNDKRPAVQNWKEAATTDPDKIRAMWGNGDFSYNVGVYTGKFRENQALLVLDVDQRENKNGFDTLRAAGYDPGAALSVLTPNGRHYYYVIDEAVPHRQSGFLGEGLDLRSKGGYVVGPGSVVGGKTYRWADENSGRTDPVGARQAGAAGTAT